MKRLFCILLSLLCLLAACTTAVRRGFLRPGSDSLPAETSSAPPTRRYVALGDSIARGYGLDDPETQAYPALLRDRMQSYSEVEYANYAVDGQTSAGLLELLSSGGAPMLDGADVVTVCIGANNLLGPTIGLLSEQLVELALDMPSLLRKYYEAITGGDASALEEVRSDLNRACRRAVRRAGGGRIPSRAAGGHTGHVRPPAADYRRHPGGRRRKRTSM